MDRINYMKVSVAAKELGVTCSDLYHHIRRHHITAIEDSATGLKLIHYREVEKFRYSTYYRGQAQEGNDDE